MKITSFLLAFLLVVASPIVAQTLPDFDQDGVPDHLDLDDDNDGQVDIITDSDNDGLDDSLDSRQSPHEGFKEAFEQLENKIKEKCEGYKIVPFNMGKATIEGLTTRYLQETDATVNEALFNQFLGKNTAPFVAGNEYYGYEAWRK